MLHAESNNIFSTVVVGSKSKPGAREMCIWLCGAEEKCVRQRKRNDSHKDVRTKRA